MANGLDFFFFLNIKIGALFCVTEYICDHVRNSFNMFKNRTCVVFKVSDIWTANHKTMNRYEITISNKTHTHTHNTWMVLWCDAIFTRINVCLCPSYGNRNGSKFHHVEKKRVCNFNAEKCETTSFMVNGHFKSPLLRTFDSNYTNVWDRVTLLWNSTNLMGW